MKTERRLAAIMFTDIVGYTQLMGDDKEKAFAVLSENRQLQRPVIEANRGQWIKELGDGVMASFPSVTDALHAAINIQQRCNRAGHYRLRIGIHHGEVEFSGGDVFGDGVNIASRIQSVAVPGGIFISAKVYDDIRNLSDIQAVPAGKFFLKNVRGEMELFAISNSGLRIPDALPRREVPDRQPIVLVLPFVNMSGDQDQEYFSDGLTEELIYRLSKLNSITVIPRTTAMQYKQAAKDVEQIRRETGARYLVEGSVRSAGKNLRITAQFLDSQSRQHVWSDSYQGTLDEIFEIQEKVATRIVDALRMKLSAKETQKLRKRYTANAEAYQLYLKGRYYWKKRNGKDLRIAIRYFEQAIEQDSQYALAWAGIADVYSLLGEYTTESRKVLQPKVMQAVNKALQLDPFLAEAHVSLGITLMLNEWDWARAEQEFIQGIEQSPNYATGHHWYAELLLFQGRMEEAFREISMAVELDPLSQGILKDKGIYHYYNRQYDDAIEAGRQALELDPGFCVAHRLISMAYCGKEEFEKSIEENRLWEDSARNGKTASITLAHILASAGRKQEALQELAHIEATDIHGNDNRAMALVYAALGDADTAFSWLDKSYRANEESLCSLKVDPKFDNIRADERFTQLLKNVGLA